ncbi:hypothetical protein Droror1_Dr00027872 [Drosera rotundifolia]
MCPSTVSLSLCHNKVHGFRVLNSLRFIVPGTVFCIHSHYSPQYLPFYMNTLKAAFRFLVHPFIVNVFTFLGIPTFQVILNSIYLVMTFYVVVVKIEVLVSSITPTLFFNLVHINTDHKTKESS